MYLPEGAKLIIDRLRRHGYRGDIVGGCVRDNLLSLVPYDYDITTSATPEEMQAVFSDMRTIETGLKHGTLTVIYNGEPYEVTTYRLDGEYTDNRHPDSVSFTRELSLDLSRRDFTVNAMCYNDEFGITDLFGGREDLAAGIIRAVGEPSKRFTEDALRILRALRFAATLDFTIEKETAQAIRLTAHLIKNVSRERVMVEWTKLLSGVGAYRIISEYFDVLSGVIPNITLSHVPSESAFLGESAAVRELSLFDTADDFDFAMKKLRSDNRRRIHGALVLSHADCPTDSLTAIKLLLVDTSPEVVRDVCALKRLRYAIDNEDLLSEALRPPVCYEISHLALRGDDLKALGFVGKEIGNMLNLLLHEVAKGNVENDPDSLRAFLSSIK